MSRPPLLSRLPLVGDLFDRRAAIQPAPVDEPSTPWVLLVAAGVAGLSQASEQIVGFFAEIPPVPFLLKSTIPTVVLVETIRTIVRRRRPAFIDPANVDESLDLTQSWEYREPQARRVLAKVLLLPLVVVCALRTSELVPNGLRGERVFAAFVCTATSELPVVGAKVELRSISGRLLTSAPMELLDNGLFVTELDPWSLRPASLKLSATTTCQRGEVPLVAPARTGKGCPGLPDPQSALLVTCE